MCWPNPEPANRGSSRAGLVLAIGFTLAALAGCGTEADRSTTASVRDGGVIGLSTSLPIYWPEAQDISELVAADPAEHWALAELRGRGEVRPLDSLAGQDGTMPLPRDAILVLAQPYPFSADENVALDSWVRGGGRVLLFADPMLTRESAYALGDRRRPQDIAMLDPILARWGLALSAAEDQALGETAVRVSGIDLPVNLPGEFSTVAGEGTCKLEGEAILADCRIGKGRIIAIGDAALLESADADSPSRQAILATLLDRLAS